MWQSNVRGYLCLGVCVFFPSCFFSLPFYSHPKIAARSLQRLCFSRVFFFFNKFIYLFICLFMAALGLHCCAWAFSSWGERGLLFVVVRRLLTVVASLVAECRLQACGLQQLWHVRSVVVACGLQSSGSVVVGHGLSCSAACWIFPDQGSNLCPLHWQADS